MRNWILIAYALALNSGCPSSPDVRAATYGVELEECNLKAQTLCESIACEQLVRVRYGRPTRPLPSSCVDAGKDGAP